MNKNIKYGVLAVVVILALAAIIISNNDPKTQTLSEEDQEIIASVNSQSITMVDIKRAQKAVALTRQTDITVEQALERVIGEKLMLEEADKLGITLTPEEAEAHLSQQLAPTGKTLDDVKKALISSGEDYDTEMEVYREQVSIDMLLEEKTPLPEITDEEAQAYYEENKNAMFPDSEVIVPYEQIATQLKQAIAIQKQQEEITTYVENLRSNADIVYLTTPPPELQESPEQQFQTLEGSQEAPELQ
ncbi:MAG: SurA N-terminal domain-containing protein [archaeon]